MVKPQTWGRRFNETQLKSWTLFVENEPKISFKIKISTSKTSARRWFDLKVLVFASVEHFKALHFFILHELIGVNIPIISLHRWINSQTENNTTKTSLVNHQRGMDFCQCDNGCKRSKHMNLLQNMECISHNMIHYRLVWSLNKNTAKKSQRKSVDTKDNDLQQTFYWTDET
jgi:hypothetical protein